MVTSFVRCRRKVRRNCYFLVHFGVECAVMAVLAPVFLYCLSSIRSILIKAVLHLRDPSSVIYTKFHRSFRRTLSGIQGKCALVGHSSESDERIQFMKFCFDH